MVTAEQRLALMRGRAQYEPHQTYTPDNAMSGKVHQALEQDRENQIDHIGERLVDAHERLQTHRDNAVHEGRAAAGFNRATEQSSQTPSSSEQDVGYE